MLVGGQERLSKHAHACFGTSSVQHTQTDSRTTESTSCLKGSLGIILMLSDANDLPGTLGP